MHFLVELFLSLFTALLAGIIFVSLGEAAHDPLISIFNEYAPILPDLFLLLWICRLSIFAAELILLRRYLTSKRLLHQLLSLNVQAFLTLSTLFFFTLPLLKIQSLPSYLKDGAAILIAGLIGAGEARIKLSFIKSHNLTQDIHKVTKYLRYTIVSAYMMLMAAALLFMYIKHRG